MNIFESKLDRLIKLYNVECPPEFRAWLIDLHNEDVLRVIGPNRDLSTYEDIDETEVVETYFDAYHANFFDAYARNDEHKKQLARARESDYSSLTDRITW